MEPVITRTLGRVFIVCLNRPEVRNAVNGPTAAALQRAFSDFDASPDHDVAILHGAGGHFCAGADLKAIGTPQMNDLANLGPMGPTAMQLSKPTIAAIEGVCVAGGLELALWCDLRVAAENATFGVFCRSKGVPLIDGGTVRLPRIVGRGRALDMVLTGRAVGAAEALSFGLVNRVVSAGSAVEAAIALANEIAHHPPVTMRNDRRSVYEQESLSMEEALKNEFEIGRQSLASQEYTKGAAKFVETQKDRKSKL